MEIDIEVGATLAKVDVSEVTGSALDSMLLDE